MGTLPPPNTQTFSLSTAEEVHDLPSSNFRRITELPGNVTTAAIETVVKRFCNESTRRHDYTCSINLAGLYHQTLENIGNLIVFKPKDRFLWMANDKSEILAYTLAHISKDIDNNLCYYLTQAWASPSVRGNACIKDWIGLLREHAKSLMCKHMVVVSSRGSKGYCRFLGKGWEPYVALLKLSI